jgi:tetratricopeptide (TPR) repeat protein
MPHSARRPRLSVAVIVRDAAEALAETLACLPGLADETVVLDTGSADQTKEVARQFPVTLHERPWDDDFSAARNYAAACATGDWLLWLDAGERLSPGTARSLREFVDAEADRDEAYTLLVSVPRAGRNIAGEQVSRIRLVPNRRGLVFSGRVRETLVPSLADQSIAIDRLPLVIERGAREHDPQLVARKARRNLHLADLEIAERGPLPHLVNCQAEALHHLGDDERAAVLYRRALAASVRGSPDMLEAFYGLLAALDRDVRQRSAQLSLCLAALEAFPLDAQLLSMMGGYLQAQGRLDLAIRAYQTADQFGQVTPEVWHLSGLREVVAASLLAALELQTRRESQPRGITKNTREAVSGAA